MKITKEIYEYSLEVFNNEEDKYKKFLDKNNTLSEIELRDKLNRINYGNF